MARASRRKPVLSLRRGCGGAAVGSARGALARGTGHDLDVPYSEPLNSKWLAPYARSANRHAAALTAGGGRRVRDVPAHATTRAGTPRRPLSVPPPAAAAVVGAATGGGGGVCAAPRPARGPCVP